MSGREGRDSVYRKTTERFRFLQLVTEVRPDGLCVRLEPIHRSVRHVPAAGIDDVNVTNYSATSYGGWHWGFRRSLRGHVAYRLRGGRGVEFILEGGERLFVGSRSPSDLRAAARKIATADRTNRHRSRRRAERIAAKGSRSHPNPPSTSGM